MSLPSLNTTSSNRHSRAPAISADIAIAQVIMAPSAVTTEDTSSAYPNIPPFPNNVPTAPLLRLNFSALQISEPERNAFFQACKDLGFFYLDLRGDELGEKLLAESEQLFGVGEKLFQEGAGVLNGYDYSKGTKKKNGEEGDWEEGREPSYMGYKSMGKGVVDAAGNRDKNEFYNVSSCSSVFKGSVLTHHRHRKMIFWTSRRTRSPIQSH